MAHNNGSFSYKTINPVIKGILDSRSELNNTVQVAMPFIKATTTIAIPELGKDNVGFTLGMHMSSIDDMRMNEMYSDKDGNALVGYTYTAGGKGHPIYAQSNADAIMAANVFNNGMNLVSDTDFSRIPPPGITKATIGRNKNGLLAYGEIEFSVPILPQLEYLHKVFLVPGMGMVLEWGQQFASDGKENFGERGIIASDSIIEKMMFPWYNRNELMPLLHRLGSNQIGLQEIIERYVWPTQGQYMWMFGRIANFNTKPNSDGSYTCTVKIVGPSEDAWAYSTRNTVIPPRNTAKDTLICPDGSNSVESYFTSTSPGTNLKSLLEDVHSKENHPWHQHVYKFTQESQKEGQPTTDNNKNPNVSQKTFADAEDSYFMTWRFFVNVVLNDPSVGVKAIFKEAKLIPHELEKISLLRPYEDPSGKEPIYKAKYINDDYENYVGNHKYLRSVDPSVMIIVNENAANWGADLLTRNSSPELKKQLNTPSKESGIFLEMGDFNQSTGEDNSDRGFLSTGVWLNHKSVVQSMASSDTVLRGIINLLDRMNSATMGYWQLTLDVSDPQPTNTDPTKPKTLNYTVIDSNYRENSQHAVANFIDKVHVFNKYVRKNPDGKRFGSDVLDCSVDLSLPKRLFSQIATMGLVQPNDIKAATGEAEDPSKDTPIVSDPNETLRKMFAITSLSVKGDKEQGPDLTILPKTERETLIKNATCGKIGTQTTAETAGLGAKVGPLNAEDAGKSTDELTKQKEKKEEFLKKGNCANPICQDYVSKTASTPQPTPIPNEVKSKVTIQQSTNAYCAKLSGNDQAFCNIAVQQGITDPIELAQMLGQFKHESNLKPVEEQLAYSAEFLLKNFPKRFTSLQDSSTVCCGKDRRGLANRLYGGRMGNTGPDDGWTYRGRGFVQLTGKDNYREASRAVGVDLVENPNYLLTFEGATKASIWYWNTRVKPSVRRNNTTFSDTAAVTKAINGGAIGLQDRQAKFSSFLTSFGISPNGVPSATPSVSPKYIPPPTQPAPTPAPSGIQCSDCVTAQRELNQINAQISNNVKYESQRDRLVRQFPQMQTIFRYVEPYGDIMVATITRDADGNRSNAFGASPGTLSISADITLPGINGLRVGELFWIDRIPSFYKAFGAFQILSIEDSITKEGWTTQIHSRFNYMGNLWKEAMAKKLTNAKAAVLGTIDSLTRIGR